MKTYRVERTVVEYVDVNADNAADAEEIAFATSDGWNAYDLTLDDVRVIPLASKPTGEEK